MASISYVKVNWQDGESGGTPISAENLGKMDDAIANLTAQINANTTAIEQLSSGSSQLVEQVNSGIEEVKDMLDVIAEEGFADASNINYVAPVLSIKDTGSAIDYLFDNLENQIIFIDYFDYRVLIGTDPNPDGAYVDSSDPDAFYGVVRDNNSLEGIYHNKLNILPSTSEISQAELSGYLCRNEFNPTCETKTVDGVKITNLGDGKYHIDVVEDDRTTDTTILLGDYYYKGMNITRKLVGVGNANKHYVNDELVEFDPPMIKLVVHNADHSVEYADTGEGVVFSPLTERYVSIVVSKDLTVSASGTGFEIRPMITTNASLGWNDYVRYAPSNWEIGDSVGKANAVLDNIFENESLNAVEWEETDGSSIVSVVIDELRTQDAKTEERLDYLYKITQGIIYNPSQVTYSKGLADVPSGALKYASLDMLGGMSIKQGSYNPVIDIKVSKIEVIGKNLFDKSCYVNMHRVTDDGKIDTDTADNPTCMFLFRLTKGTYAISCSNSASFTIGKFYKVYSPFVGDSVSVDIVNGSKVIEFTDDGWLVMTGGENGVPPADNIQIEKGSSVTTYEPYTKEVKYIPELVQSLNGYGAGFNSTCYNYLEFEDGKVLFHKKVASVDLGNLSWVKDSDSSDEQWWFDASLPLAKIATEGVMPNMLIGKYKEVTPMWSSEMLSVAKNSATFRPNTNTLCIKDLKYTDANAFKSAVKGVILNYELAEEVVIDVTSYFDDDFEILKVEPNKMIRFYSGVYEIPTALSKVTYMIDLREA